MRHVLFVSLLILTSFAGQAQDVHQAQDAVAQLVEDELVCAYMHQTVSNCVSDDNAKGKDIKNWTAKGAAAEIKMAAVLGKTIGMSNNAIASLAKVIGEQTKEKMNGSCVNLPAVVNQERLDIKKCKIIMESPDTWLKEIKREQGNK